MTEFKIYNAMETHLDKIWQRFLKCRHLNINLNPPKVCYLNFWNFCRYIVSREWKLWDPKKVATLVSQPTPIKPNDIQVFNSIAQFYWCFIKTLPS